MSKYRLSHSSIYIEGSDVPKNKFGITCKFIDNGAYIEASIECVQYADSSRLNRIVFEGLSR
jgi:hypothetical protein